jgi:hypothetical protein
MISGFKIGLADWEEKLQQCKRLRGDYPAFVEIYFRVDKIPEYEKMFEFLEQNQIKSGLHFWGVLKSGIEPNLLSRNKWIANQSVMLMQSVIKVAQMHKCVYVNVHPGALKERQLNLNDSIFGFANYPETEFEEGRKNLLENAKRLQKIADKYRTMLTYETLPTNSPKKWLEPRGLENLLITKQCPIEFYEDLVKNGYFVANDFGHTACSIDMENEDRYSQPSLKSRLVKNLSPQEKRKKVKEFLFEWTKKLAENSRLIHCNLSLSPFDGVDTHLGLLSEDFAKDSLPNRDELIELLNMFRGRDDIFILNEPENEHVENYVELKNILEEI